MRSVLTGAGGFLGKPLSAALAAFGEVAAVDGDIRQTASFDGLRGDVLVHLAAQSNVPAAAADPKSAWDVNVVGTRNALAAARRAKMKRFVLMSSAHVYGKPQRDPVDESHPLRPVTEYGKTKLAAERIAAESDRIEVVVVRPFNIYGPGQAPGFLVPDIYNAIAAGGPLVLGDPRPVRDYTFLDDAIAFLVRAATVPDLGGAVLNLGSGEGHAVSDVVAAALDASGSPLTPMHDPKRFRADDVPRMVAGVRRAGEMLGWHATVSLRDGMKRTWAAWPRPPSEAQERAAADFADAADST